jgi:hypothetical protein
VTVRAAWHGELRLTDDDDPFADGPMRIEDVGTPIVLDAKAGVAKLQTQLVRSLVGEGKLAEQGVTCAIKNAQDTSCFACRLYRDDDSPEAQHCALGRLQESLCTEIVVTQRGGRR